MPKLVIITEDNKVKEARVTGPVLRIGRHPTQDVQVLDPLVSKEHARIVQRGQNYFITDLNSRNGTFVNRRLVTEPVPIADGDEILLGTTRLRFVDESSRAAALHRVTIAPETSHQASIQQKLPTTSDRLYFPPLADVQDEDALRNDYEKLRLAYQLSQDLALETRLDVLLEKILDSLFQWLRCDRAVILLEDPTNGELVPRHVKTGLPGDEEISISHTILRTVAEKREAILSNDAQVDSRFSNVQSIIMQGIRSTMTVPMLTRERLIGAIHVDSFLATNAYTPKDLNILQGFARQAALAIENSRLVEQARREAAAREKFQRLLSPNLVDRVVSGQLEIRKGGEQLDVTVLFTDIRGFTAMTERQGPQAIVEMLNEYFEILVEVIFEFEGTVDKFIGDAIMAFWGAPVRQDDAAQRAVAAALKMQRALRAYNGVRRHRGQDPIEVGIGIDTGPTVVGYMGSSKTMSYTLVGERVNRAARLCDRARAGEILVSDDVFRAAGERFRYESRGPIQLKGISLPVTCYRVLPGETSEPRLDPLVV